jgi:hypothetical protein
MCIIVGSFKMELSYGMQMPPLLICPQRSAFSGLIPVFCKSWEVRVVVCLPIIAV